MKIIRGPTGVSIMWTRTTALISILCISYAARATGEAFCSTPNTEPFYALVVDGGTTGSRMRVYEWDGDDREGPVSEVIPPEDSEVVFELKPGLSSYAPTGEGAGKSLGPLVDAAKTLVPEGAWARTPLFVLCTGGVRLIEPESAQLAVLGDARVYLSDPGNSPFLLQKVAAISGDDEGLGLYVSLNGGTGSPEEWTGALDMGGASLQYAFSPNILLGSSQSLLVNDDVVKVFSASYDRFGKDNVRDRYLHGVVEKGTVDGSGNYLAECFAPNYLEPFTPTSGAKAGMVVMIDGTGDGDACEEAIDALLHLDDFCGLPPCGLMGRYVPKVNNDIGYMATSSFYYAAKDLGLIEGNFGDSTAGALYDAAIINCADDLPTNPNRFDKSRCFDALYCARFLSANGFEDQDITFLRKLQDGRSVDWTLGTLLMERAAALLSCDPEACEPLLIAVDQDGPLNACEGDCDKDTDCEGDLVCFQRDGKEKVPGCSGQGVNTKDYCTVRPSDNYLFYKGNDGPFPLGLCEGDCDVDSHCEEGFHCYRRTGYNQVPGCDGLGPRGKDFCIPDAGRI